MTAMEGFQRGGRRRAQRFVLGTAGGTRRGVAQRRRRQRQIVSGRLANDERTPIRNHERGSVAEVDSEQDERRIIGGIELQRPFDGAPLGAGRERLHDDGAAAVPVCLRRFGVGVHETNRHALFVHADPGSARGGIPWSEHPDAAEREHSRRIRRRPGELFIAVEEEVVALRFPQPSRGTHDRYRS
jgi:hypothetical protein